MKAFWQPARGAGWLWYANAVPGRSWPRTEPDAPDWRRAETDAPTV